jgi:hypothetical integral membrane protein (TIGR02206 family)
MHSPFILFGPQHLVALAAVASGAILLSAVARHYPSRSRKIRLMLAAVIGVNESVHYLGTWLEGSLFPDGLPLHLSDITILLVLVVLVRYSQRLFELTWYFGIAGAIPALLTPDIRQSLVSLDSIQFFISHGLVVISLAVLTAGERHRPRKRSWLKVFLVLNVYAVLLFVVNNLLNTNYMYLLRKPEADTVLDFFGPWPWYILISDLLALIFFYVVWIPFRKTDVSPAG